MDSVFLHQLFDLRLHYVPFHSFHSLLLPPTSLSTKSGDTSPPSESKDNSRHGPIGWFLFRLLEFLTFIHQRLTHGNPYKTDRSSLPFLYMTIYSSVLERILYLKDGRIL